MLRQSLHLASDAESLAGSHWQRCLSQGLFLEHIQILVSQLQF